MLSVVEVVVLLGSFCLNATSYYQSTSFLCFVHYLLCTEHHTVSDAFSCSPGAVEFVDTGQGRGIPPRESERLVIVSPSTSLSKLVCPSVQGEKHGRMIY